MKKAFTRRSLREKRANLNIVAALRAIRSECSAMFKERDFTARRGFAMILQSHLQFLVQQPEYLPPLLRDGTAAHAHAAYVELDGPHAPLCAGASPFDPAALDPDNYFYYTSQTMSALCRPPRVDPIYFNDWHDKRTGASISTVYVVWVARTLYIAGYTTTMHLESTHTVREIIERNKMPLPAQPGSIGRCLMIDPAGAKTGYLVVGASTDDELLIKAADELHRLLDIRFLVAEPLDSWDFH